MSRFILGDCVRVMATFPDNAVDFILTDPPYLVGFRDRQGRTIAGDVNDDWLQPASNEMYRVLKKDALMVSFYGWNRIDRFMAAWKRAGFSVVGHLVFTKNYTSKAAYVGYRHECAYSDSSNLSCSTRRINSGLSASTAFRAFILNVPLLRKWTLVSETGKGGERRFK